MEEIEIQGLNEVIYTFTCDNGLKVYMWVNKRIKSTFMSLSVNYGSVHTEFSVKGKKIKVPNGVAHFLEHIKFNEKDGSTAHDFFHKTGADVNAFTTFDYTSYHVHALNSYEENLIHLLDFVQTPYFTEKMIEKEKGIIIEEGKMGEDDPNVVNYFGIFKNLFEKCNYKNLITGEEEDIKKTTLKDIENVYNNFYHPENMFAVITGNFNPHETMQIIKQNQNNKKFDKFTKPEIIIPKEKLKVYKESSVVNHNVALPKIKVGIKIPRSNFENFSNYDLRTYASLLLDINFGSTSEFKDYVTENKLASYVNTISDIYDNYFILIVSIETRFPEEMINMVKEKLAKLEISKEVIKRKKRAKIASLILSYDDVEAVNYKLQDYIINYNKVINNTKEYCEKMSIEKLKEFNNLLDLKNSTTYIMTNKNSK